MELQEFEKIKRADVPPMLFNSIIKRIEKDKAERVPNVISVPILLIVLVFFAVNISFVLNPRHVEHDIRSIGESFNLIAENNLYE